MHPFRIVSLVNSWVARLLCLPPMFRFVRLGVQRENHCDCTSDLTGQVPKWRKPKIDCHNERKLVSDPMTLSNYRPIEVTPWAFHKFGRSVDGLTSADAEH
jgi:hypothetical protein